MSSTNEDEDLEESKHFNSCVRAFLEYGQWLAPEFKRRVQHRNKLSSDHVARVGGVQVFQSRHQTAINCLQSNAELLSRSIQHHITQSMQEDWSKQENEKRGHFTSSH